MTDTWQIQLQGAVNTSYAVRTYDIDLFDTPQTQIDALHGRGIRVICYFSAGSSEDFRSDYGKFTVSDQGNKLDGWPGERWLDVRSTNVRSIMRDRMDLAVAKKCDAIDPDNVDGFANNNGLGLSGSDQIDYNMYLATQAHLRNLAIGLKNDLGQVLALVSSFDFQVNEQCHEFSECGTLTPFITAGKPVFNIEYLDKYRNDALARATLCATAKQEGFRTLVLPLKLDDSFRFSCD